MDVSTGDESFLGLKIEGDLMRIEPCIPEDWKSFSVIYRYKNTTYTIQVIQVFRVILATCA